MAGRLYQDEGAGEAITDINVTPFVDVVLVLLVVFIVTAKLIVARGIDMEKPKAATGGEGQGSLTVQIKADGSLYVNGTRYDADAPAVARIKEEAAKTSKPKAIVTGEPNGRYGGVMHAIDLVKQAGDISIFLENVPP